MLITGKRAVLAWIDSLKTIHMQNAIISAMLYITP